MRARPIPAIELEELRRYAVWEFDLEEADYDEDQDESWVYPVRRLPVDSLANRIIVTDLILANGDKVTGTIMNMSPGDFRRTKEFLFITAQKEGEWRHLARYFDLDYDENGSDEFAEFLGLSLEEVFPIRYDVSSVVQGLRDVVVGEIPKEPLRRLTRDERSALQFPELYPELSE